LEDIDFSHCRPYHRVHHQWQEAENWYRGRLTIKPQTFCGLKEIDQKTMKIQQKNRQCVIITRLRITNKMPLHLANRSAENWCADGLINFEESFSGLEE